MELRKLPNVFIVQSVAMLSGILNSDTVIQPQNFLYFSKSY